MPGVFANFVSSISGLRNPYKRYNADGTIEIKARAHGALTAKTPYVVYIGYDGPRTLAVFDTGATSASAAGHQGRWQVGIPNAAVSSDTDGWLQVGGYCGSVTTASTTATQGAMWLWHGAVISCQAAVTATAWGFVNCFAVAHTSASATTSHNMYLLDRYVYGLT